MCVWLADLQPHTRKSSLELLGQPRARGEATNEECELFLCGQGQILTSSGCTDRTGGKALTEVVPNGVHDGFNRGFEESGNLCSMCMKA